MAYTKQTWQDLPNKTTPINAARLGHIEDGIFDAAQVADSATTALGNKVDKVPGQGLSTNDYSDADKAIVDAVPTALAGKADLVADAVNGNLASLDSNGNLADSGAKASDFASAADVTAIAEVIPESATSSNKVATAEDVTATVDLMKDTTGWTGKNRMIFDVGTTSGNGVNLTLNGNKTFTVNTESGGATALTVIRVGYVTEAGQYILNGCPEGGGDSTYRLDIRPNGSSSPYSGSVDSGSGSNVITVNNNDLPATVNLRIPSGSEISDKLFKPMIRRPNTNPDYEPYHESVEEMLQNKVGDTIYLNHCILSGHVTSGGSDIFVTLPFKCSTISGVTVDANCIVNARGNSGYIKDSAGTDISSSYKFVSNLKCSQILQGNNGITSVIIKNIDDNAFTNVTNNTPVALEFLGNITLT